MFPFSDTKMQRFCKCFPGISLKGLIFSMNGAIGTITLFYASFFYTSQVCKNGILVICSFTIKISDRLS